MSGLRLLQHYQTFDNVQRATATHQMAPRDSCRALGFPHCHGHRKVSQLKLGAEHIPFPCSLRELVLDRYGAPAGVGGNMHPMPLDELLDYLTKN